MSVPGWGDVAIDLSGLELSGTVPILSDHDSTRRGIVGYGRAEVKAGKLLLAGSISAGTAAAREIVEAAKNGFPWQASVAAEVLDRRQIPAGKFAVLKLEPSLDGVLQRGLERSHGSSAGVSCRLKDQAVPSIFNERDDSKLSRTHRVFGTRGFVIATRPVAALDIQDEACLVLVASSSPAHVDPPQRRGMAVVQGRQRMAVHLQAGGLEGSRTFALGEPDGSSKLVALP
jgi:hypothetical protein